MYSKYKIENLIEKYAKKFKHILGITGKVRWHVVSSQTKKYKNMKVSNADLMGLSLLSINGRAEIFIYYDKLPSEREAIATIFHELVHLRMYKLTGLLTINADKGYNIEEVFVRDIEQLFMRIWYDKLSL